MILDGAIHRAAGPGLLEECRYLHGCETGKAKITGGYNLPAQWVIHTVGPIWHGGSQQEDQLLAQCYRNSLHLAQEYSIKTIAFPAISTGSFRFPIERAVKIAAGEITKFLEQNPNHFEQIILVCFSENGYHCYENAFINISE